MNVHQLELFYHLAVNQGVSRAARALEKEQPTLSRQINDLEASLGVQLYRRRPFQLTEKGELLFRAIEPFFRELPRLEQQVRGGDLIRIGGSLLALADHLPAAERQARRQFPGLRAVLREGNQPQLMDWLAQEEIDLAITLIPRQLPQKMFAQELIKLPMVLLVPRRSPIRRPEDLWRQKARPELVCLTDNEIPCREFQAGLRRLDVEWRPAMEVGSLELVHRYVSEGYGVGLSVRLPRTSPPDGLRELELPGFPSLPFGLLWRNNDNKVARLFRELLAKRATEIM